MMTSTYSYKLDGQLRSAAVADGAVSEFLWDGLALIRRDGVDYLNEPHPNGGSPVLASDGRAFFNDILGTSQGTLNDRGYEASSFTAFGDGADGVFFTGKPKVDDASATPSSSATTVPTTASGSPQTPWDTPTAGTIWRTATTGRTTALM